MNHCFSCGTDLEVPTLVEAVEMEEEYRTLFEPDDRRVLYCDDCYIEAEL